MPGMRVGVRLVKRWEWVECVTDHTPADMGPDVHHLLLALVRFADEDGRCYPSNKTLARVMKVHVHTVPSRIRRAVACGWLVVDHLGRWKGDPSRYRLTPQGCPHAAKDPNNAGLRAKGPNEPRQRPQRTFSKTPAVGTERIERSNEGADGAPLVGTPSSPLISRKCSVCARDFFGDGYSVRDTALCSTTCQRSAA